MLSLLQKICAAELVPTLMRKARIVYLSASIGKLAPVLPIGAVPGIGVSRRKRSGSVGGGRGREDPAVKGDVRKVRRRRVDAVEEPTEVRELPHVPGVLERLGGVVHRTGNRIDCGRRRHGDRRVTAGITATSSRAARRMARTRRLDSGLPGGRAGMDSMCFIFRSENYKDTISNRKFRPVHAR